MYVFYMFVYARASTNIHVHVNFHYTLCSVGENLTLLVDRPDESFCFRLHKDRVYYVRLGAHERSMYMYCIHVLSVPPYLWRLKNCFDDQDLP